MKNTEIRIFYSWQSDLPNSETRGLIQDSISSAVKMLRDTVEIEADRDTKGEYGSPDIVQTIFSKIDECDIFIADVSIVNKYSSITDEAITIKELAISIFFSVISCKYSIYLSVSSLKEISNIFILFLVIRKSNKSKGPSKFFITKLYFSVSLFKTFCIIFSYFSHSYAKSKAVLIILSSPISLSLDDICSPVIGLSDTVYIAIAFFPLTLAFA